MQKRRTISIVLTVLALAALFGATIGVSSCKTHEPEFEARALAGDVTNLSGLAVAAPTAIATATPALMVNSSGVSNLLEVRDAATPVFQVHDGGNVTGKVVRYGTAGELMVVGTETITDTLEVTTGLTTVTWALCTLGVDADTDAGDPVACTVSVSGNAVTVKLWQDDWSAGGTASQTVHWMAIGTP
jgi:hypothetical protein